MTDDCTMTDVSTMEYMSNSSWSSLPRMIQDIILREICDNPLTDSSNEHSGLASLASVCREWQVYFERHNFRRLVIVDDDLGALSDIVRGAGEERLGYIQHLWLRIELATYDCRVCERPENESTIESNNYLFTSAMRYLMKILARWPGEGSDPTVLQPHMTLEISAASPSDSRHGPRLIELEEGFPFHFKEDLNRSPSLIEYIDEKLGDLRATPHWVQNHPLLTDDGPSEGAIRRICGTPLKFLPVRRSVHDKRLEHPVFPPALLVKAFVMRQHFHRSISVEALVQLFQQSLIRVKCFHLERGILGLDHDAAKSMDMFRDELLPRLPSSLQRLSLSDNYVVFKQFDPRHIRRRLARCLAACCRTLEEISIAAPTKICSRRFLDGLAHKTQCDSLHSVCVNYPYLGHSQPLASKAMQLAAHAAEALPSLRVMELWSASLGHVCLFRFSVIDSTPTITWMQAGVDWEIEDSIRKVWEDAVAAKGYSRSLRVVVEPMPHPEDVKVTAGLCILHHLQLRELAFDAVTMAHSEALVKLYLLRDVE